jgi:hypothetical protein
VTCKNDAPCGIRWRVNNANFDNRLRTIARTHRINDGTVDERRRATSDLRLTVMQRIATVHRVGTRRRQFRRQTTEIVRSDEEKF